MRQNRVESMGGELYTVYLDNSTVKVLTSKDPTKGGGGYWTSKKSVFQSLNLTLA